MSKFAERMERDFSVRRTPREKENFRSWLLWELREMGYHAELQSRDSVLQSGGRVTNVVAGDPDRARLLLVAHYDTGLRPVFPPLLMPTRPLTGFLYMALTPVCAMLASFLLAFVPAFLITAASQYRINLAGWTLPLFLALLAASLCYLRFGPPETRNTGDNASGVAALLEIAGALTPRYRGEVAFAFLDGGFGGLSGAKGFRAAYPSSKDKPVFNLNCVALGDELMILPGRAGRWNGAVLDAILESFESGGRKTVFLKTDGLTYYPSDNRAFRMGFAVFACEKLPGFGRIVRPRRAVSVDGENLEILKKGFCRLAETYRPQDG